MNTQRTYEELSKMHGRDAFMKLKDKQIVKGKITVTEDDKRIYFASDELDGGNPRPKRFGFKYAYWVLSSKGTMCGDVEYIEVLGCINEHNHTEEAKSNLRERVKQGDVYYYLDDRGTIQHTVELFYESDDERYLFGNYFITIEQADCVSELKQHVYQFPIPEISEARWILEDINKGGRWSSNVNYLGVKVLDWNAIHQSATEQDRENRLGYIKDVINTLGYIPGI